MKGKNIIPLGLCYIWKESLKITVDCKYGHFTINGHREIDDDNQVFPWIKGCYKSYKILSQSDERSENQYCYLILKELDGNGIIMEVASKEVVKKDFKYEDCLGCEKTNIEIDNNTIDDFIFRFLNPTKKEYSLYSIMRGYIYGPYIYKEINVLQYGTIIDKKFAVNNDGWILDISSFTKDGMLYYSKEDDQYYLFVDEDGTLFEPMEVDPFDDSILTAEVKDYVYKYNKATKELSGEINENGGISLYDFLKPLTRSNNYGCEDDWDEWD